MTDLIYVSGGALAVLFLVVLVVAVMLLRRGRRRAGAVLIVLVLMVVAAGGYGIHMFWDSSQQAVRAQVDSYDNRTMEQAEKNYQEALVLLRAVSLENADVRTLKAAQSDLEAIEANGHMSEVLAEKYPDVPVLLSYTKLLLSAAKHEGGLNSRVVMQDKLLMAAAEEIPAQYSGQLSDKILPVRQLVLAMKAEGEKQVQQDAKDLAEHQQNMNRGEYGLIAKGDPESKLVPAFGKPVYVNEEEGSLKQYVFLHNSHNIYVYTKNGVVTEVRGM